MADGPQHSICSFRVPATALFAKRIAMRLCLYLSLYINLYLRCLALRLCLLSSQLVAAAVAMIACAASSLHAKGRRAVHDDILLADC